MKSLISEVYDKLCSFQKNISKSNNSYLLISDRSQELVDVQKVFTNLWKLVSCTANKCVEQSQWFISITSWCNLGWLLVLSSLRKPNCVVQFYAGANPSAPSPLGREVRRSSRHVKAFCKYIFPCLLMLFINYASSLRSFVKLCNVRRFLIHYTAPSKNLTCWLLEYGFQSG